MEQNEIVLPAEGSIADILRRLEIWCQRADEGFSRVQYFSEFSRIQLVDRLRNQLKKDNIAFHEIHLPTNESPSDFTRILLDKLNAISSGVVSITGFPNPIVSKYPIEDYLRALNFNRENLAKDDIRQVWWVSAKYIDDLVRTAPDLDSWFVLRLHLTENAVPSYEMQSMLQPIDKPIANIDEARKRSAYLKERFINALKQGAPSNEILEQIVLPAVKSLHEAGADIEAKELSSWMLEQLSESDLQKPDDPNLADNLENLAKIYHDQGDDNKAEILLKKSLDITENVYGSNHENVAIRLNNLALLYKSQGSYKEAEPLYLRAIDIDDKILGEDHPDMSIALNNLAELYRAQGEYEKAEPLYFRVIEIDEKTFGYECASHLNNLAKFYCDQGKYEQAELLFIRAIEINEKALGKSHPDLAVIYDNLAGLYFSKGNLEQAQTLYDKAISIDEKTLGKDHPLLAKHLNNLSMLYYSQGEYEKTEMLLRQVIDIFSKILSDDHPDFAIVYENYTNLLQKIGRESEAQEYESKAQAIRSKRILK